MHVTFLVINNEIKYNGYYKSCDRRKLHEQLSEPGKQGFRESLNSEIYIDKTGLIEKQMQFLIHVRSFFVSVVQDVLESQWQQIAGSIL